MVFSYWEVGFRWQIGAEKPFKKARKIIMPKTYHHKNKITH